MTAMNVQFTDETAEALEQAATDLGTTKAGVLRDGIRLVRRAMTAARAGGRIAIVEPGGKVSFLVGSWSDLEPATA